MLHSEPKVHSPEGATETKDDKAPTSKATERIGLTNDQAEALYEIHGYNELPHVEVSLLWIFFVQFTGLMPYMLEIACVLALAVQDWIDFAIIAAILICNGYLGFHEELKAKASLDELTSKMEQKIAVLRDGKAEHLLTRLLVPGDVILLVGGCAIPADVDWLEGDVLSIDTAGLTGEPLPRKYPSEEHGNLILCGCTVKAGEAYAVVRKTGINTEVGGSQADIMKDKTEAKVSVFEQRVLLVVKMIIIASIADVLIIFLVQGFARHEFTKAKISTLILTCLSIIIAAVPVALPLVLQVTMALGAGKMARDFNAVVTSLPALQDISSMSVLCSDKTGTLTTAKITIHAESVWTYGDCTKEDVALYAALASNRDKKEDPIDRSVIGHFDKLFGPDGIKKCEEFEKIRGVGFNPIYKRVVFEFKHPRLGNITIAKGLPTKVCDTKDGESDDAADQWEVEDCKSVYPQVAIADKDFSKAGYKTLGVAFKINDGPWKFCGILPMLDPPRHDTAQTIKNLVNAGITVKMITGDHLNIAKETARLIGMGTNIHKGETTRAATQTRNELIWDADGFAQVLPRDKREVVLVLKDIFKIVVGMTGDGVNDAPALSAAQCGVAVDDATDAAKNAAAIILTSPGLSAIYSAVVESRRIFRKLKAYVTYRFAATIQIVIVLTLLIYISNCPIDSLYIILLALFNDLTMLPIAYDRQQASKMPEDPDVNKMLYLSGLLGGMATLFTMMFSYGASNIPHLFTADYDVNVCSKTAQAGVWLQMSVAAELLIFSARAPSYMWTSIAPSAPLFISVMIGCLITSIFAADIPYFGSLPIVDIVYIWIYDVFTLVIIDIVKVQYLKMMNESLETLPDTDTREPAIEEAEEAVESKDVETGHVGRDKIPPATGTRSRVNSVAEEEDKDEGSDRLSAATSRLNEWATRRTSHTIGFSPEEITGDPTRSMSSSNINVIGARRVSSSAAIIAVRRNHSSTSHISRRVEQEQEARATAAAAVNNTSITVSAAYAARGSSTSLAGVARGSLRPYVPANIRRK